MRRLRQLLTIFLITFAVCGVQVIQSSPLHDHSSHVVGCALCHFDSGDAPSESTLVNCPVASGGAKAVDSVPSFESITLSPYQSRAPPRHSL